MCQRTNPDHNRIILDPNLDPDPDPDPNPNQLGKVHTHQIIKAGQNPVPLSTGPVPAKQTREQSGAKHSITPE